MSALSSSATATYGVKAIRQMKATNTSSLPPEQTQQLARRKQRIYAFFVQKVDPILGEMITALLLQQPADVTIAMIEYLKQWGQSESVAKAEDLPSLGNKPKKEMKLFLATNIAPIISKLVNRIAVKLPEDVIGFMVQELQSMQTEDALLLDQPQTTVTSTPSAVAGGGPSMEGKADSNDAVGPPAVQQTVQIAVLGAGGAGKTSIVNALQGKFDPKVKPTIGFRPLSLMLGESTQLKLYDLGGGKRIRDIWDQYYHDVHGFIYVLDASDETLLDPESESRKLFQDTLNNSFLRGKPLLIFANKQDKEGARSAATWQDILPIPEDFQDQLFIAESTAMSSQAAEQSDDVFKPDPNIEAGIELLCRTTLEQYAPLQQRVTTDSAEKAKQEARKRLERERKVLRSKIAAAFFEELSPELVAAQQIEADPSNIFDVMEGLAFLAAEIGHEGEPDTLPAMAQQIAALVGYQRLALQIIGALKAPISKKKTPMSWEEILTLVMELRAELQLP